MSESLTFSLVIPLASAEAHRTARAGRGSDTRSQLDNVGMIMACLLSVAIIIWFAGRMIERRSSRRSYHSRRRLFRELCRAHHLARSDKRLLRQVARLHQLSDPSTLFLRPELFSVGMTPPSLRHKETQLRALHDRLFAGLTEDESSPTPSDAESFGEPMNV